MCALPQNSLTSRRVEIDLVEESPALYSRSWLERSTCRKCSLSDAIARDEPQIAAVLEEHHPGVLCGKRERRRRTEPAANVRTKGTARVESKGHERQVVVAVRNACGQTSERALLLLLPWSMIDDLQRASSDDDSGQRGAIDVQQQRQQIASGGIKSSNSYEGVRLARRTCAGLMPTPSLVMMAEVSAFCLNSLHTKPSTAVNGASLGTFIILYGSFGSDVSVILNWT